MRDPLPTLTRPLSCADEIPLVLLELNESALIYLQKEQYENALLLLQKAHGVLDVVDTTKSQRDSYIALQVFYNMAMCYQKLGQLQECALCLETCLEQLCYKQYQSLRDKSISSRIHKLKFECRVHLQLCAIYSQLHRHKDAYEQAEEGVRIAHLIVRDQLAVCHFFAKKMEFEKEKDGKDDKRKESSTREGRRSQKRAKAQGLDSDDSYDEMFEDSHELFELDDGERSQSNINESKMSGDDYMTEQACLNDLEAPISLTEKSSVFLKNIYIELLRIIKPLERSADKKTTQLQRQMESDTANSQRLHTLEEELDDEYLLASKAGSKPAPGANSRSQSSVSGGGSKKQKVADMRHVLGFLNQSEWIISLNIGNIMQISPVQLEDMIALRRNEQELDRFAFLETVSFLCVGYFCVSTEIRFIIQLKEEISSFANFDIAKKTQESELWHTKSLEVACSFLTSDCPLLNHILLSYQKHHAPSQTAIPETQSHNEVLRIVKPVNGIENCKFRPIVRTIESVKINLTPVPIQPARKAVVKMLHDIKPRSHVAININQGGMLNSRFASTPDASLQQSSGIIRPKSRTNDPQ